VLAGTPVKNWRIFVRAKFYCAHALADSSIVYSSIVVKYPSICTVLYHDSSLKCSGMACVNEGSHSFTCHQHVYPQAE